LVLTCGLLGEDIGLFILFIILGNYNFLRRLSVIYRSELDDIILVNRNRVFRGSGLVVFFLAFFFFIKIGNLGRKKICQFLFYIIIFI
jgi:hypothetical protein